MYKPEMKRIIDKIQVNVPFRMLEESYLPTFIKYGINPEIGFDAMVLDEYSSEDYKEIAEKVKDNNLTNTIHGPFLDLCPGSLDKEMRDAAWRRYEQVLKAVRVFRPERVIFHAGYDYRRYDYIKDLWYENSIKVWKRLAEAVNSEGSRLLLENVYENGPEEILPVLENLNEYNVGFCFDIGHMSAFGRDKSQKWLDKLGPYLAQLHLHDNSGLEDEHAALGKGKIDFKPVFRYLQSIETGHPAITLEPHKEEDLWPSIVYLEREWTW